MQKQQKFEDEVLQKLRSFCAYRERASSEVKLKASQLDVSHAKINFFLKQLEQEGFLNDQRFAELFARSKFRQNHWGKYKIKAALFQKRISEPLIELALTELDEIAYEKQAFEMIEKQIQKGLEADAIFQKMKMKGYEGDLVYSILQKRRLV
jgi:regulatory protein